jgi:glycosyltransferase involved in cell wall biosynthesis
MSGFRKTILILSSRFPFPLEKGDKLRIYHQIKELSVNNDVVLISLTRKDIKPEWRNELDQFCKMIYIFKLNSILVIWNTFKALFSAKPFQVGYFYQKKIHKEVVDIVKATKPDVLYCQLIRTAEYIKDIHDIPKTIDYMDALSAGMERRALIVSGFYRFVFSLEGSRLKKYENTIFDYFDNHTIISIQDQKLIHHPSNKSITIIPNGIDNYFLNFNTQNIEKEYDLVFVGNLSYPPNIESCDFIVNQILPYFNEQGKKLSVLLSGAEPSIKILKYSDIENVTVSGWVDDIRLSYCKGRVFVAPLFIGTGLQNKLLEAMSLNVPCVTTSLVNNALGAKHEEQILVADSLVTFCQQIDFYLQNPKKAINIADNGKQFVENKYDWKKSTKEIPL